MDEIPLDDISANIDQNMRDAMLDVILSWARYDSIVTQWVILAYNMPPDAATMLLGNMDTRTKLERIKAIYEHHGMKNAVAQVAALQKRHLEFVSIRNNIAHSACAGHRASDPQWIVFAPVKSVKGKPGYMAVEQIRIGGMRRAAEFAKEAADKLVKVTDAIVGRRSIPPPEPPVFLRESHPTPRGSRRGKRQQQPRSNRG